MTDTKAYGEFKNVHLSELDYGKLIGRFGQEGADERIEKMSAQIAAHGYKYKNFYAAILSWERKDARDGVNTSGVDPKDPDKYIKGKYGHLVKR